MNKRIYYIVLIAILNITILGGYRLNSQAVNNCVEESGFSKEKKKSGINKNGLKVIDYFLPEQNSRPRSEVITHVVIHFISNVLNKPREPYDINDIRSIFIEYNVSSHYVIDRKGNIYRFVPENRAAYHAGTGNLPDFPEYENCLNDYSIGIELLAMGNRNEMLSMIPENVINEVSPSLTGYTEAQYSSLRKLLADIVERNPYVVSDRKHIIGHDEYAQGRKRDPGVLFDWSRIGL